VKLRVRVDYSTYSALKEVEGEYREVLEEAINYGLSNETTSFTRIKAGIYKTEREKHKTYHPISFTPPVRTQARGWTALRS